MSQVGKRVYAVDLARGLAVFFMILVHVLITYANSEVEHSIFGGIIGVLGGPPAAPVFMATMGISFYYSRNTDLMAGIKRGLYIILLGYVLNFCRGVLPVFLVKLLAPAMAAGIPEAVANYYDAFLELDILHFAGLSLIVMAILRELKVNKYFFLLLAVVVALVSPMLWGLHSNNPVANHLLDYLWGDKPSTVECIGNLVSFPFFPWFSFVLVGMFLGQMLTVSTDPNKIFKYAGIIGVLILVVSSVIIAGNPSYHVNDYYHSRPGFVFFIIGIILTWLYACNVVVEKIKMNRVFDLLFYWSKHVNRIFIIQWVLVMAGADAVLGFNQLSYLGTCLVMITMTIATHFINEIYLRFSSKE